MITFIEGNHQSTPTLAENEGDQSGRITLFTVQS